MYEILRCAQNDRVKGSFKMARAKDSQGQKWLVVIAKRLWMLSDCVTRGEIWTTSKF